MDRSTDALILEHALVQQLHISRPQLLELGVTDRMIARRLRRGFLHRLSPGVYAVGRLPDTLLARVSAAELDHREAVAYGPTAAELHGFPGRWSAEVELLVPHGHHHTGSLARIHQTRWLPAVDVGELEGVRLTTPARTLCDLSARISAPRLRWVAQRRIVDRRPDLDELVAVASSFVRRGRKGSTRLRRVLDGLAEGPGIPASVAELEFIGLCIAQRLPAFERQFRPPWYDGVRGIVDFARRAEKVLVEVDSRSWHAIEQAMADDRRRDRLARRHGWHPVRVMAEEVRHRPDEVADDLRATLRHAGYAGSLPAPDRSGFPTSAGDLERLSHRPGR